ncbi:DNA-binding protein [Nocardioides sp. Root122]|uniref:HU family DNA-binding protein n=1 Tax=Nocardioides TaxID=1839 RepID=UPI00070251E8|nr:MULTISPECIES: HU family DNA-binding protein [Nocardioides]KQV65981.1 DNA-binding protein [Nocardioides sp. Root122]MCK9823073.1 HU family DNA-binding protein [Nocardioides cavernae]
MNKSELIDALAARYEGNRKQAAHALESVLDTITREVAKGEKVAITGFGSFEKAVRNARWVRNPQTGDRIKSKKKSVPKFSAGKELKDVVSGAKKLPKLTAANMPKPPTVRAVAGVVAGATATAKKAAPARTTASKSAASGTAAKKTTAKKSTSTSTAKKASASSTAKKTTAKKAPAKKASSTSTAKKAPAKKTSSSTSTAKKTTAAKKTSPAKKASSSSTAKKASSSGTAKKTTAKKTAKKS